MISASKLPVTWRSSTYSSNNGGQCLEVGEGAIDAVPVRDSKNPHGPALLVQPDAWAQFVSATQRGQL